MPVQFNDYVDDPMGFDGQASFIGGMVSNLRADQLGPSQAALLQDVAVEINGVLRTRRGFRNLGNLAATTGSITGTGLQGLHYFDVQGTEYLVAMVNGKAYRMDSGGTWTLVNNTSAATTGMVYTAQVSDRLFVTDGTAKMRHWSASEITASAVGTQITDGPATFLRYLCAQKFRVFAVDAGNPDTLYTSIFLPSGATPFTAGATLLSIRIGEGEGDAITGLFAWKGFLLVVFKESSIWSVDTTPAAAYGTGTVATAASDYSTARLSGRIGCVAHRSAAMAGNDLLFLSRDGVRSMSRTIADGSGAVSEALSFPIDDYIQRINWAAASTSCAVYWQGRYYLGVPLDSATQPNTVLVYQPSTQAWTVFTGLQPVAWEVTRFGAQPQKLVMLDARGNVLEFKDWVSWTSVAASDYCDRPTGSTDVRIPWRVVTRGLNFNEPLNPKQPDHVEVEFDASAAVIDVKLSADGDVRPNVASRFETGGSTVILPVTLPVTLGTKTIRRKRWSLLGQQEARHFQVELTEAAGLSAAELANSAWVALRQVTAGAFVETMEVDE
jgi:hypothetical protein